MSTIALDADRLERAKAMVFRQVRNFVAEIDNWDSLEQFVNRLSRGDSTATYVLTEDDKAALERGRKDYEEGRCIDHDEFMRELDEEFEADDEGWSEEKAWKESIIDRIECIHDVERLCELATYIDDNFPECVYELTPEEERLIDEAEQQLDAGQYLTNEEFRARIDECLRRLEKQYG